MAMLQQRMPSIGCKNAGPCTRAPRRSSSLAAAPPLPLLVHVPGSNRAAPRRSSATSTGLSGWTRRGPRLAVAALASDVAPPPPAAGGVCTSDVLWPSAGAFLAMALLGRMDQMMASKGVSMTIAPLGAVSAVLFTTPNSPSAKKYNMFVAQVGCAALGVLAFSLFGPGWLARSIALAASLAFMIITGAAGCIVLCLIQEVVMYLKRNCKF